MIVIDKNDPEFDKYADLFYNHFSPDDWDYMIMDKNKTAVEDLAEKLKIYDYQIVQVDGQWVAVTYHS